MIRRLWHRTAFHYGCLDFPQCEVGLPQNIVQERCKVSIERKGLRPFVYQKIGMIVNNFLLLTF